MMKVFLAFSFSQEEDRELVSCIEQLLASHYVQIVTGERLGGEQLTPVVKAKIDGCHALIALMTRRGQPDQGKWQTHPWVRDELNWARDRLKLAIALVEDTVEPGGMYGENERIPLIRGNSLPALLALSETIGIWKRDIGRTVKVRVRPDTVTKRLSTSDQGVKCSHRFFQGGRATGWKDSLVVPEPGGTFIYIEGVQDDHMVQIQVQDKNKD